MNKKEIISKLYDKKYLDKLNKKIKLLGKNSKINLEDLIISRFISSVIIFIIIISSLKYGYIIAPFVVIVWYYLFAYIVLDSKIKKRTEDLEKDAMHFFEVLTLSLETGRNLVEAIEVTTKNVDSVLSLEFKETIREVKFGKSLSESLTDMQERIPSETINNIILSLTEANVYGNSIINNLYDQVSFLREKRKMEVKGRISKVPILISVISVFFFVPLLLLIILGPVLLDYIN